VKTLRGGERREEMHGQKLLKQGIEMHFLGEKVIAEQEKMPVVSTTRKRRFMNLYGGQAIEYIFPLFS